MPLWLGYIGLFILQSFYFGINAPLLLSQTAVVVVAPLSVLLGGGEQFGCFCRVLLHYRCVTDFALEEVFEGIPIRLLAVECERILAFKFEGRIVAPQMPVAASYGVGLFLLGLAHTGFDTVVDTRSVGDDDRRSVVGFGLADGLQSLSLVGAHSYLCGVNIAVGGGNQTEVFLTDTLAGSGELGDCSERSGF